MGDDATSRRVEGATAFLGELGAGEVPHPGGLLLSHLQRTHDLLRSWGAADAVCLAGLVHAAYGTDGFPTALLPLAERDRLRRVVGDEAEEIVYLYDACDRAATYPLADRTPLPLTDRFSDAVHPLDGDGLRAFALLTIANELDVVRHAALDPATVDGIGSLVERLAGHAPGAAALALAELRGDG